MSSLLVKYRCPTCGFTQEYAWVARLFPFEHCKGAEVVEISRRYEVLSIGDKGELVIERVYFEKKIKEGYRVVNGELLSQAQIKLLGLSKEYPPL
jgi:hypothetical protein